MIVALDFNGHPYLDPVSSTFERSVTARRLDRVMRRDDGTRYRRLIRRHALLIESNEETQMTFTTITLQSVRGLSRRIDRVILG